MGTLLVAAIVATNSQTLQLRRVAKKEAALQLLDRFLTEWAGEDFQEKALERCTAKIGVNALVGNGQILNGNRFVRQEVPSTLGLPGKNENAKSVSKAEESMPVLRILTRRANSRIDQELEVVRIEVVGSYTSGKEAVEAWIEVIRRGNRGG